MDKSQETEYKEFEEKVKRTICVEYVSPQASESVLKEAFNQFGTVKNISFIPNYLGPTTTGKTVLIEMDDIKQAKSVVSTISKFPFMISGMPRPVQARPASVYMFVDRPAKPGRKMKCRWLAPDDPDYRVAKKLKMLAKRHAEEAASLLKRQLEEEKKLAAQQLRNLKTHYKKLEILDDVMSDKSFKRLANHYNVNIRKE